MFAILVAPRGLLIFLSSIGRFDLALYLSSAGSTVTMAEFELDSLAEVVEEDKLDELFETGDGVNGVNGGEDGTSGKAKGTSSHNEEDAEEGTSEEAEGTVNHRAEDADALGGVEGKSRNQILEKNDAHHEVASIFGGHLPEEVEAKASNEAPAIPCEAQQQPLFDLQAAESALPPLVPLSTSPGNSKLLDGPFAREAVPWLIKNGKGPPFASREHRLTICDLPNELLRNAFDCMQSRVHMRNCQKVCKAFYDNSLHHMYRNVRIDLPEELTEWQRDLLGDNHRGLRHIQQLHLWPVVLRIESTAVFRWVAQLLKRLEHGQLQDFWYVAAWIHHTTANTWRRWVSPRQMPFRLYDLLWSRQPNLTRVDIRPLYGPEDDTSEQDKFANLQVHSIPKLDHLFIVPDVVDLLGIGSKVLEKLEITKLTVYGRSWKERDIHTSILPSAREDEDKLVQGLFAHQRQSAIRCGPKSYIKPSCLSMLELSEVNLRFCRSKWFACNDFRNLSELVIKYCPYADVFLTRLMQSEADSVPALDYFTLVHKLRDVGTERTLIELNELVKRCFKKPSKDDNYLPGPRMLDLHLRNIGMDALPEARAIGTSIRLHRKTLESLCVDYMYRTRGPGGSEGLPKAVIWEPHELNGMLRGCRQLRELALAVPSYSWHYRPGQLLVAQGVVFTSFVVSIFDSGRHSD